MYMLHHANIVSELVDPHKLRLFTLLIHVYKNLDQGKYVVSILFDVTSAFNTVNVAFLATKLENIGIRGKFLDWITSYI